MKWTAKDLYVVNQSLKQTREDGAIPKKLQLGRDKYNEWVNREPINWNQLIYDMRSGKSKIDDSNGDGDNDGDNKTSII